MRPLPGDKVRKHQNSPGHYSGMPGLGCFKDLWVRTFGKRRLSLIGEAAGEQAVVRPAAEPPAEVVRTGCCLRLPAPLGLAGMLFFFHDATRGISSFHP